MKILPAPDIPQWITDLLPTGHRRYAVGLDDSLYVHVTESGSESGFPVLMLHGNPTWGFLYRKLMAALADDGFRCIAPDLVGLGFSTKPGDMSVHTLASHAAWIGAVIDALNIDALVFVGQDWGGPIGVRALADRPGLMKGLVLMNTAVSPPKPGFSPTTFHRFSHMPIISDLVFRGFSFPQRILHRVQGDPASISGDVARAYRYPLRKFSDRAAPLALARMVPDSQAHPSIPDLCICRDFISAFSGPARIVWGTRDPILGRALKRMTELLPAARVTRTDAGHFLQEEVPEEIADAVRWVAGVVINKKPGYNPFED